MIDSFDISTVGTFDQFAITSHTGCLLHWSEFHVNSANRESCIISNVTHLSISRECHIDLFVITPTSELDIRFEHFVNLLITRNTVSFTFGVHNKTTDDLRENVSLFHI